jgi:hypothetical protein
MHSSKQPQGYVLFSEIFNVAPRDYSIVVRAVPEAPGAPPLMTVRSADSRQAAERLRQEVLRTMLIELVGRGHYVADVVDQYR